jgi:pyrroloquinoline-quinone synthase
MSKQRQLSRARRRSAKGTTRRRGEGPRTEAERFFSEIELLRRRWDVLQHPFYERWSAGELDRGDLRVYAEQYRQAVVAIAEISRRAAEAAEVPFPSEFVEHALEERKHVEMWLDFARATGWSDAEATEPLAETAACVRVWSRKGAGLDHQLTTLYAIEVAQPKVSRTKLDGLRQHYGIADRGATRYFRVHATRDREHAALARRALTPRIPDADAAALLDQAEATYRANWRLLDGVDRPVKG